MQIKLVVRMSKSGLVCSNIIIDRLKDDFHHTHALVSRFGNGSMLVHASDRLKDNFEIVFASLVHSCGSKSIQYASERLKNDFNSMRKFVSHSGSALQYAHESLKDNFDIVFTAVSQDGSALQYAHESLKDNFYIVLAAVSQHGYALRYAHESLKDNFDIVLAAFEENCDVLQFASLRIQKIVKQYANKPVETLRQYALQYAHESLKDNFDIAFAAVSQNGEVLQYASQRIQEIVKQYANKPVDTLRWYADASKIPFYTKRATYFERTDLMFFTFI